MESTIRQFLFDPKWKPLRHVSFWLFMYMDEVLSFAGVTEPLEEPWLIIPEILLDMIIVYVNLYLLMPRFFQRKKVGPYLFLTGLSVLLNALVFFWIESQFYYYEEGILTVYISVIISTLSILGTAIGLKLMKNQVLQAEQREKLTVEKNKIELRALKNQINPHFLFNVLNTVYVQTQVDPEGAKDTVMHLADLLRYQIYDASEKDLTALSGEIEFLKNYMKLEALRREFMEVTWALDLDKENSLLPPFLLLPIIENAIKHSKSTRGTKEKIEISISVRDRQLRLLCKNTKGNIEHDKGGIGIETLNKRLSLLYPDRHDTRFEEKDGIFIAELAIDNYEIPHNR